MANDVVSPNMGLLIPTQGVQTGPQYALDINQCLATIDLHDHTPGKGVQLTPQSFNINADFPMNGNSLTGVKSIELTPQTSISTLDTVYCIGVDLYYTDGNGNVVRITQGGNVAGATGSIVGLVSPASATYIPLGGVFVWQSDTNKAADMDFRSAILRNAAALSKGLTLNPPDAMVADISMKLPNLPTGGTKFLQMGTSGDITAAIGVDNVTIEIATNNLQVKDGSITNAKLAANSVDTANIVNDAVTNAKLAPLAVATGNIQDAAVTTAKIVDGGVTQAKLANKLTTISTLGSSSFTTSSTSYVDITNLSVSFTVVNNRPIVIQLAPIDDGTLEGYLTVNSGKGSVEFTLDGNAIAQMTFSGGGSAFPPSAFSKVYAGITAGSKLIKARAKVDSGASTLTAMDCYLVVYQL